MSKKLNEIVSEDFQKGNLIFLDLKDCEGKLSYVAGFINGCKYGSLPSGPNKSYLYEVMLQSHFPNGQIIGTMNIASENYTNYSEKFKILSYEIIRNSPSKSKK